MFGSLSLRNLDVAAATDFGEEHLARRVAVGVEGDFLLQALVGAVLEQCILQRFPEVVPRIRTSS